MQRQKGHSEVDENKDGGRNDQQRDKKHSSSKEKINRLCLVQECWNWILNKIYLPIVAEKCSQCSCQKGPTGVPQPHTHRTRQHTPAPFPEYLGSHIYCIKNRKKKQRKCQKLLSGSQAANCGFNTCFLTWFISGYWSYLLFCSSKKERDPEFTARPFRLSNVLSVHPESDLD